MTGRFFEDNFLLQSINLDNQSVESFKKDAI
ncbi:hypothetical protein SAMN05518672_111129 [Chitinophaga sp. CF118]|nr:hypothetical protein SAMN05518672_111129 [Chitinophaga sp. CF118]